MNDYTELDAAITQEIKAGRASFTALSTKLKDLATPFAGDQKKFHPTPPWRVIDRRLQALRKKGVITYSRADGRWHLVQPEGAA